MERTVTPEERKVYNWTKGRHPSLAVPLMCISCTNAPQADYLPGNRGRCIKCMKLSCSACTDRLAVVARDREDWTTATLCMECDRDGQWPRMPRPSWSEIAAKQSPTINDWRRWWVDNNEHAGTEYGYEELWDAMQQAWDSIPDWKSK